jgi:hypothetical protein
MDGATSSRLEENQPVNIEILHIEDCDNWHEAGKRVRTALDATGHRDMSVEYRLLQTSAQAAEVPFAGSPTILSNGVDVFPSDGRTTELACRIYPTATGLAGMPTVEQLIEVSS